MTTDLPRLEFRGADPMALPGVGRVLRDPERYWSPDILEQPFIEALGGRRRLVLVAEPEAINRILANQDGTFPRARLHDRMLGATYGENLLRGDQVDWRRQRGDLLRPFRDGGDAAHEGIDGARDRILDEWATLPPGEALDIIRDARRFTLDSLWRSFFRSEDPSRVEPLVEQTALALDAEEQAPLSAHLATLQPLARLAHGREQPWAEPGEALDLNTMLLFLHAGHDNVAAALAWGLWLLAVHPEAQARVREEWRSGATAEVAGHPFLGAVISETLRLYPPIMHLIRDVESDIAVDGHALTGGFTAVLSLYAMHRNRRWWDEPDRFRPERFLTEMATIRRRSVWLPFGTGPRGCVGSTFARSEMVRFLGAAVDRFELVARPEAPMTCRVDFVLRPAGRSAVSLRPAPPDTAGA